MNDEIHYRILRLLESRPDMSQRQLSQELGVSLGKANYCLQALVRKGWNAMPSLTRSPVPPELHGS